MGCFPWRWCFRLCCGLAGFVRILIGPICHAHDVPAERSIPDTNLQTTGIIPEVSHMLASGLHLPISRICSAFVPIFQPSNPPTQWDHPSNDASVCLSQISTTSAGLCHVCPQPPWLPPAATTAADSSRQRHILPAWRSGPGPLCPKDIKGPWQTKENEEQLRSWKLLWNRLGCEVEVGTNWVWKWWWVSCWVVLGGVCSWWVWLDEGRCCCMVLDAVGHPSCYCFALSPVWLHGSQLAVAVSSQKLFSG